MRSAGIRQTAATVSTSARAWSGFTGPHERQREQLQGGAHDRGVLEAVDRAQERPDLIRVGQRHRCRTTTARRAPRASGDVALPPGPWQWRTADLPGQLLRAVRGLGRDPVLDLLGHRHDVARTHVPDGRRPSTGSSIVSRCRLLPARGRAQLLLPKPLAATSARTLRHAGGCLASLPARLWSTPSRSWVRASSAFARILRQLHRRIGAHAERLVHAAVPIAEAPPARAIRSAEQEEPVAVVEFFGFGGSPNVTRLMMRSVSTGQAPMIGAISLSR